jgi:hypothetical protein
MQFYRDSGYLKLMPFSTGVLLHQKEKISDASGAPDLLIGDLAELEHLDYCTPVCLTPAEIYACRAAGDLPKRRLSHVLECEFCSLLVRQQNHFSVAGPKLRVRSRTAQAGA